MESCDDFLDDWFCEFYYRINDWSDRMKFLLLGKGKTTLAIAKFLKWKKQTVWIACNPNEQEGGDLLLDFHLLELKGIHYVIKSPGISQMHPIFKKIAKKMKVISELDLLTLFDIPLKMIAITGSNGKTTCVTMIENLLKNANYRVITCGNSHEPLFQFYDQFSHLDFIIMELSSFQLENLSFYHPYISSILNLDENHLDSVKSLKDYYRFKKNIYRYCDKKDYFIYNINISQIKEKTIPATVKRMDPSLFYKVEMYPPIKPYTTQMMVLYEIVKILQIDPLIFIKTLKQFQPLPYRQQVKKINHITFINDSKSTSVAATIFAFEQLDEQQNIILIIGGKNKHLHYEKLKKLPYYRLLIYGEISKIMRRKIKNAILFDDLKQAFCYAIHLPIHQKVILFSPATSSFDQYENYQARGKHFDALIDEYEKEINTTQN